MLANCSAGVTLRLPRNSGLGLEMANHAFAAVSSGKHLFDILFEDPDLLVINKPADLVCHPTKTDEYSSLISRTRLYLGSAAHPQLINRLDRETSGVTLVAKNLQSAREIRRSFESREVEKQYLTIVHGHPSEQQGTIDLPLGKDELSRVAIKDCVRPDGRAALTAYEVLAQFNRDMVRCRSGTAFALLRVTPKTGRKHQIRIHLASIGHPIVGDKLYGANEDLYLALVERRLTAENQRELVLPHHALHAESVKFNWRKEVRCFRAAPEQWFRDFLPCEVAASMHQSNAPEIGDLPAQTMIAPAV